MRATERYRISAFGTGLSGVAAREFDALLSTQVRKWRQPIQHATCQELLAIAPTTGKPAVDTFKGYC
jgi:hypothetical protein